MREIESRQDGRSGVLDLVAWARRDLPRSARWLPRSIVDLVKRLDADHRSYFVREVEKLEALDDADLVGCAQACLRNVGRIDREDGDEVELDLRAFLVPEVCERILPGTRKKSRRITTSAAEHHPEPRRPSLFRRFSERRAPWGTTMRTRAESRDDGIRRCGGAARARIALLAEIAATDLADRIEIGIDRSQVRARWSPSTCVYEPALTYRVLPVLVDRMIHLGRGPSVVGEDEGVEACHDPVG